MSSILRKAGFLVQCFGLDPRRFGTAAASIVPFLKSYTGARKAKTDDWPLELMPALGDRGESAGSAKGHYFHMDLWAARNVFAGNFRKVVDVGSRVDGYVAHILAFRDIEVFDVRPMTSSVKGMSFTQADMMNPVSLPENYADCVSCLHALEHFGLGRYGDPLDLDGWSKGLAGLTKILATNGTLLLAVPVGRQRIEFDAHRVFHPQTILDAAEGLGLRLSGFSAVDDAGDFVEQATAGEVAQMNYGCGCFSFKKI
jgi:hypothetical protein